VQTPSAQFDARAKIQTVSGKLQIRIWQTLSAKSGLALLLVTVLARDKEQIQHAHPF
jgi:hypothetical protein